MAYVEGRPIDEAVRGRPLDERLTLFLQLGDGVAHAHRNLLVHRDLKPGNVLVTPQGQVLLLDFGIAKALDPAAGDSAVVDPGTATLAADRLYTPHHASPKQVRGAAVTTATDIYSLGVLLYQVITGVRPNGRQATTPAEAARCVLEGTAVRPSAAPVDTALDPQWPERRKRIAGDLDNLLLKALAKPIERRYTSVEAMAKDIRSFQGGYPVSARAPSRRYLFGMLVLRNRGVAAALTVALLRSLDASIDHLLAPAATHREALLLRVRSSALRGLSAATDQARRRWNAAARSDLAQAAVVQALAPDDARLRAQLPG